MKRATFLGLGLMMAVLAGSGAGLTAQDPKQPKKDHPHGAGPNGGVIFDLGKYHAEFTVDHGKKECYVLFVDGDNEKAKPLPVAGGELIVTTKPSKVKEGADKGKDVPAMTITLKAVDAKDGKAAKYVGTDAGLANVADFEGTVAGEVGGKPASGKFKE
jgi:hypothetical protein